MSKPAYIRVQDFKKVRVWGEVFFLTNLELGDGFLWHSAASPIQETLQSFKDFADKHGIPLEPGLFRLWFSYKEGLEELALEFEGVGDPEDFQPY